MVHAAVLYTLDKGPDQTHNILTTCRKVLGVSDQEMEVTRDDSKDSVFYHEIRCSLATLKLEGKVESFMFSTWGLTPQ
jgi:hypothetical protein